MIRKKFQHGFSLIEMVVAVAIFAILLSGVVQLFSVMTRSVKAGREQTVLASLASSYLEIIRNIPFGQVGTVNGNPIGTLEDQTNPVVSVIEGITYQIYYEVTFVDDPADGTVLAGTDPAPNDYKQVKMHIKNTATGIVRSFSTNVTPLGLEDTSNAGALAVKVFDSQGLPIANAAVRIENIAGTILLDRTTDSAGNWTEVGLPPGANSYRVIVTKSGFSTDQTSPITPQNPNPTKPDPTIVNGQVTQVSFSIDRLSNLTIKTLNSTCTALSNVGVNITGAKLIGTNPDVLKYNANLTSAAGQIVLNNIEWDTYTPTLLTGQNLMVLGTSPIQQISVLPGVATTYTMILGTQTNNSLLVIVKDAASGLALAGASVHLQKGASNSQDYYATTSGSVWTQSDWTGGGGQVDFVNPARYFADDANLDVNSTPTGVRLKKISGRYVLSGQLVSSPFDTGAAADFTIVTWQPISQDPSTTLRFKIASNNDNVTWNYQGPDGTAATYYTVPGSNISASHDNNRYLRYQVFLDTTDDRKTPVLTSLGLNYVSGCSTPGQVSFGDLTDGNNYNLTVTLAGYQNFSVSNLDISGNQTLEVLLSP